MLCCFKELQGQLKLLVPTLQDYVILAYQDFGEGQQMQAQIAWEKEKGQLLDELEDSHQERVKILISTNQLRIFTVILCLVGYKNRDCSVLEGLIETLIQRQYNHLIGQ